MRNTKVKKRKILKVCVTNKRDRMVNLTQSLESATRKKK